MQLAATPAPASATSTPAIAFSTASQKIQDAAFAITFAPNVRVDIDKAIASSKSSAQEAVALLTPFANDADPFVQRGATGAIAGATAGINALGQASAAIEATRGGGMVVIPAATFLEIARRSFAQADAALWAE